MAFASQISAKAAATTAEIQGSGTRSLDASCVPSSCTGEAPQLAARMYMGCSALGLSRRAFGGLTGRGQSFNVKLLEVEIVWGRGTRVRPGKSGGSTRT